MGASGKLFLEIRAEMAASTYEDIPAHLRDEMKVKSIDYPEMRETYQKDVKWRELNKGVAEAFKLRLEREDEIRANR